MKFNGKDIPFPTIPKISFYKVIERLEEMALDKDNNVANYAKAILKDVEPFPILKEGFEDSSLVEKYKEPIHKLSRVLFPDALTKNEIKALIPPFDFNPFFLSVRLQKILEAGGNDFSFFLKDVDEDSLYLQSCFAILSSYYGYNIRISKPMMIEIDSGDGKGVKKTYKIAMNADLLEYTPTEKAVEITEEDFRELINSQNNIELWKEKFPPNSWILRGVLIMNMMDVTMDQAIAGITSNLLIKSPNSFQNIRSGLRNLFGNAAIEVGMLTFKNNEITSVEKLEAKSIVLNNDISINCEQHMCEYSVNQLIIKKEALVISDVAAFCKHNSSSFAKMLAATPWKSYIMAPLIHDDELLGFMELASDKEFELNSVSYLKLNDILPVLALATKRFITEDQNYLEAIIQQECTTVHDSVKWRFEQEARKFINATQSGETPVFNDIIFRDVYPLYGQLDIKSSSNRRNEAVKKDLLTQIKGVSKILSTAFELTKMPAYEELLFRLQAFKSEVKSEISAGSEHKIVEFFKSEVYPAFDHLQHEDLELGKLVESYKKQLNPELHTIYVERKKYDKSVNLINQKLASYLDEKQVEAQQMYPHYFERYKTDGVEFNMYIGQSIANNKPFDTIHLQNLRLWQLRVMVEMENEFAILNKELTTPLEIASLVLAYNASLAVHFRMDEKRFDVEGAYNARYEIIKKRIDKAHIKGTKERITQPGKIAIVYSQEEDAVEYRKYVSYLANKGYFKPKIEDYALEALQGISGLRALRVAINYELPDTEKGSTVEELIKSIEE